LNGARIEQIIIESPTTLRVDTAPVNTADWDPWWAQSMIDITNADFANMRSGMYPNSFLCDPYEEIMYYTGDQGHRSHWIYHVNDETIESLSGRFEVKWIIDWNGVLYTFHDGILAFDEDELGWSEPTNWVEENGSVIGSVAFAWQAMDNYAYPYDTDGNPFNEVDQADIDALRVDVLSAQTFVRGLIRFKPVDVLDWEMTSIDLDVVGSLPGDLNEDGIVGLTDLLVAIDQWGPCPDGCTADFNNDGVVNTTDIFVIFDYWGATTTRLDTTVKIPYVNVWR
jgi:hypothetical protein